MASLEASGVDGEGAGRAVGGTVGKGLSGRGVSAPGGTDGPFRQGWGRRGLRGTLPGRCLQFQGRLCPRCGPRAGSPPLPRASPCLSPSRQLSVPLPASLRPSPEQLLSPSSGTKTLASLPHSNPLPGYLFDLFSLISLSPKLVLI